ncbi:hypothetical protein J8273_4965 [Carpediemonas membranifera]|uniref:Uncharacterized protein n=1 Tax=Carpediemonas membranifera TaxID=201153 RepID=A0A8J6B5K0_9EUKA|nr:hypothetical protein J8273_4965 [Carpediemonas membranifera]|eukprot:KAG9393494.1 hypothetical protein J8273_4965 [Carpediemonas membranifera]
MLDHIIVLIRRIIDDIPAASPLAKHIEDEVVAPHRSSLKKKQRTLSKYLKAQRKWTRGTDGRLVGQFRSISRKLRPAARTWSLPALATMTTKPPVKIWFAWTLGGNLSIDMGAKLESMPISVPGQSQPKGETLTARITLEQDSVRCETICPADMDYLWIFPSVSGVYVAPEPRSYQIWRIPVNLKRLGDSSSTLKVIESMLKMTGPTKLPTAPLPMLIAKLRPSVLKEERIVVSTPPIIHGGQQVRVWRLRWANPTANRVMLASVLICSPDVKLNYHELTQKPIDMEAKASDKAIFYCSAGKAWRSKVACQHVGLAADPGQRFNLCIRTYGNGTPKFVPIIYALPRYDLRLG